MSNSLPPDPQPDPQPDARPPGANAGVGGGPLGWVRGALDELERAGLRRRRRVGAGPGEFRVSFGTNDYLGLASDPRIASAAAEAGGVFGAGSSPIVAGRSSAHAELERRLAELEGQEAALLFPSGFAAGAGTIPALVGRGDVVFSDRKNHASLIDGCRLSGAERRVYPHADADALAELLAREPAGGRRLVVTDSLFSMDGDFAPLAAIAAACDRYGAMLLVDEAHATGVWGPTGRGGIERAAASDPAAASLLAALPAIRLGTLSKALGGHGGFVAGPAELIDWLANRARSYVFSTACPLPVAAAGLAALEIARDEPWRRERVQRASGWLRAGLRAAGWDTGGSESQIVPILVGDPHRALGLAERLAGRGIFVPAIRPPTVPPGESLLRVSVTAAHTDAELAMLQETLGEPAPSERPSRPAPRPEVT